MKIRPFLSFLAFAAVFVVLVFDNQHVILAAGTVAAVAAFAACVSGIQAQVAAGVKRVDWGDLAPPFFLMWVGLYQLAKIVG